MVIAWILLASNGIVFARYYKFILPSFQPCGIKIWYFIFFLIDSIHVNLIYFKQLRFHIHRSFMVLALILNIIALIVILIESKWNWITSNRKIPFAHSITGILSIILAVAQVPLKFEIFSINNLLKRKFSKVILGILRPDLKSEQRKLFNHVHRTFGILTFLLASTLNRGCI